MIEFLLSGGPEGTNDLLYLIISNDGHYYFIKDQGRNIESVRV